MKKCSFYRIAGNSLFKLTLFIDISDWTQTYTFTDMLITFLCMGQPAVSVGVWDVLSQSNVSRNYFQKFVFSRSLS